MKRITTLCVIGWLNLWGGYLISGSLQADDLTVSGNLTVTGTDDLWGNTLSFGTHAGTPEVAGLTLNFIDGTYSVLSFNATSSAAIWQWQQNAASSLQLQMKLDNNNTLTIYDQSSPPNANIVLNPLGTSTFANSVTIWGSYEELPNQTIVNANSILTVGLADSRYLGPSNIELPNQTLIDGQSVLTVALADARYIPFSQVESEMETYGFVSWSTGYVQGSPNNPWSGLTTPLATGESTASGNYSTAMGNSSANGDLSTAMGYSRTYGSCSTALGGSSADATYSTSMGYGTSAGAFSSVVMGQFNIGGFATGGDTTWVSTDPLLELGNGSDSSHLSDAVVIYKNGNAAFQGYISVAPTGDVPMFTGN